MNVISMHSESNNITYRNHAQMITKQCDYTWNRQAVSRGISNIALIITVHICYVYMLYDTYNVLMHVFYHIYTDYSVPVLLFVQ